MNFYLHFRSAPDIRINPSELHLFIFENVLCNEYTNNHNKSKTVIVNNVLYNKVIECKLYVMCQNII